MVKHLGTARNEIEIRELVNRASQFIDNARIKSGVVSFFDNRYRQGDLEQLLSGLVIKPVLDSYSYRFFTSFYRYLGFDVLSDNRFADLVVARILFPASKAATADWLAKNLGRRHSLTSLYRCMAKAIRNGYRDRIEDAVFEFFSTHFSPTVNILFFDVTTLYFETFDEDEFRKYGFSKDNKASQPQIVVALTVAAHGFPLHLRLFEGNTFEGHTIIPCIREITGRHRLSDLVVVADSAMVSRENMGELEKQNLHFIVGARLGNLPSAVFTRVINEVAKVDGETKRFPLAGNRVLVVHYSAARAAKDRSNREKQMKKAGFVLRHPAVVTARYKFLKKTGGEFVLNRENINKAADLEGLKGYVTNAVRLPDAEIIQKYSELWQVERSFRMSKFDLKARPVFHTVRENIEAHVLIVFAALAITRYVEFVSQKPLGRVVEMLNRVKEIILEDPTTGESVSTHTEVDDETKRILELARIKLG